MQIVAQVPVAELARLRVLVLGPMRELAAVLELGLVRELAQVQTQRLVQEPAVEPEQARELRVSRQLEPQQHRLLAAAQELPPYLPALPMKAPC